MSKQEILDKIDILYEAIDDHSVDIVLIECEIERLNDLLEEIGDDE